jgi:hypothetical protein
MLCFMYRSQAYVINVYFCFSAILTSGDPESGVSVTLLILRTALLPSVIYICELLYKMPFNQRLKIFEAINGSSIHQSLSTTTSQVTLFFSSREIFMADS